jgi:hypothetical protein
MSLRDWFERSFDLSGSPTPSISAAPVEMRLVSRPESQIAPSRDEFAAWRDDPTTQFVMNALTHNAEECREEWLRKSWDGGQADQRTLDGLRERADALLGFTADYEAFCETLNLEPEQEEQAA